MRAFVALAVLLVLACEGHKHHRGRVLRDSQCGQSVPGRPNILLLLMDDIGVATVGFSARLAGVTNTPYFEAQYPLYTPNIDSLAESGVKLTRFYAYNQCTPTRMALLSGRVPVHNGVVMREPNRWDGGVNRDNGYDGLSPNITTMAAKLKAQGYSTHMVGKMDGAGLATSRHLLTSRGFDSALGYFNHANSLWNYTISYAFTGTLPPCGEQVVVQDMFFNRTTVKGSKYYNCTQTPAQGGFPVKVNCTFEEDVFTSRALDVINGHNKDASPLFLWYSSHQSHTLMETPSRYLERVEQLCGPNATGPFAGQCAILERRQQLASVMQFDENVGRLVTALKARQMYDNTIIVFMTDNGGSIGFGAGGNNFPLRGGKGSNWEGGFRVPACIGGGALPSQLRGSTFSKPAVVSDWYATFCELAGGSVCTGVGADPSGEKVPGIVPVESVSLWPFLMGARKDMTHPLLQLSPNALHHFADDGKIWKIITGINPYSMLMSPNYPNCTVCRIPANSSQCTGIVIGPCAEPALQGQLCCAPSFPQDVCCNYNERPWTANILVGSPPMEVDCGHGCLYELTTDSTESNNLNTTFPEMFLRMQGLLATMNRTYYEPFRGCAVNSLMCSVAEGFYQNTYGPFINVDNCTQCVFTTPQYFANPIVPFTTNECQCHTDAIQCNSHACVWSNGKCDLPSSVTREQYLSLRSFRSDLYDNWGNLFD